MDYPLVLGPLEIISLKDEVLNSFIKLINQNMALNYIDMMDNEYVQSEIQSNINTRALYQNADNEIRSKVEILSIPSILKNLPLDDLHYDNCYDFFYNLSLDPEELLVELNNVYDANKQPLQIASDLLIKNVNRLVGTNPKRQSIDLEILLSNAAEISRSAVYLSTLINITAVDKLPQRIAVSKDIFYNQYEKEMSTGVTSLMYKKHLITATHAYLKQRERR